VTSTDIHPSVQPETAPTDGRARDARGWYVRPDAEETIKLSTDEVLLELFGPDFADDAEPDWQDRALCAETDPEAFFPEKGGSTREAKRICQGCEVRAECLEYALEHDERFGIWGGYSERERRKLKRRTVKDTDQDGGR